MCRFTPVIMETMRAFDIEKNEWYTNEITLGVWFFYISRCMHYTCVWRLRNIQVIFRKSWNQLRRNTHWLLYAMNFHQEATIHCKYLGVRGYFKIITFPLALPSPYAPSFRKGSPVNPGDQKRTNFRHFLIPIPYGIIDYIFSKMQTM